MDVTNQSIIDEWAQYTDDDLKSFGDDGDEARVKLLDPNILTLAGDIKDKLILDAGCGNGYLTRKLAKVGGKVVGIEPSEKLFTYCKQKEDQDNLGVSYIKQDLADFSEENKYDLAFLINVLMDIPDYQTALLNIVKSLKSGGVIIVSILHPSFPGFEADWKQLGYVKIAEYFDSPPTKQKYGYLFNRTLQDYLNLIIESGCTIEKIIEPQLRDGSVESRNSHVPQFMLIKATKQ